MVNFGNFILGWAVLFDGDDDTPLPIASTTTTNRFAGSTNFPGPIIAARSAVVPVNQVGHSTAFERLAFKVPAVL
jgi:hypothetical protein